MAEALRTLRRGLQRAEGFALFVAVCNSPALLERLIRLLQEALLPKGIVTARLDETVTDPLDAVLAQLPQEGDEPVMILGLEKSVPSSVQFHPVLQSLNLSRPEWPRKLARAVVLWVPEYLLALLGREAPDFLDWRSDTLFFLREQEPGLEIFDSAAVFSKMESLSALDRRRRIEELRSRLASLPDLKDSASRNAYASWSYELAIHFFMMGKEEETEATLQRALELLDSRGNEALTGPILVLLGQRYLQRGNLDDAQSYLERALKTAEETRAFLLLAAVARRRQRLDRARIFALQALESARQAGRRDRQIDALEILVSIAAEQEQLEDARSFYRHAVELLPELKEGKSCAAAHRSLAGMADELGDLKAAAAWLDQALGQHRADDLDTALTLLERGRVARRLGDLTRSAELFEEASRLAESLGVPLLKAAANLELLTLDTEGGKETTDASA
jgi:tetratricopeptide (TPR) repeat protein